MESDDLIYRKLQRHLDRMPVGFPESKSGNDIKILKELFTAEEAEIALELSMLPEPASRIFPRLKKRFRNVEELQSKLDDMFSKGLILGGKILSKDNNVKLYSNAQYVIGIHEFQVNRIKKNLAPYTKDYIENEFSSAFLVNGVPSQMRTIPINKGILRENYTSTYDNIKSIIRGTPGRIVLNNCVCRQIADASDDSCKLSDLRETCMAFKSIAESSIEAGIGRIVSTEEALSLVDSFEEKGFVIQPENNREPEFICFCCGCCCGVLRGLKNTEKPAERYLTAYYASVDSDQCAGCGTCVTRCQMDAISMQEEKAVIDITRCIGCGLCTSTCKTGAVALNRKDNAVTPPANHIALYQEIFMKKVGPLSAIKTMIKYKMGMKV